MKEKKITDILRQSTQGETMKDTGRGRILQIGTALILIAFTALLLIGAIKLRKWALKSTYEEFREKDDSYTLVIDEKEWGPSLTGIILNAGPCLENFTAQDLKADFFTVKLSTVNSLGSNFSEDSKFLDLKIKEVHFCDIDGNILEEKTDDAHLLLEVESESYNEDTSLFLKSQDGQLYWKDLYKITVSHPKFISKIINENDPLITKAARHQIIDMDIKESSK